MDEKPHRWFRFSLPWILAFLTILGIGLGEKIYWIRERRQFLSEQQSVDWPQRVGVIRSGQSSWILSAFGEPTVGLLMVPQDSDPALVARLHRIFPEAGLATGKMVPPDPESDGLPFYKYEYRPFNSGATND